MFRIGGKELPLNFRRAVPDFTVIRIFEPEIVIRRMADDHILCRYRTPAGLIDLCRDMETDRQVSLAALCRETGICNPRRTFFQSSADQIRTP